jgi:hypothetical protein
MVKLTEIVEQSMANDFSVRSVFVNPSHVVMVREDSKFSNYLAENKLSNLGIERNMQFTRVTMRGGSSGNYDITVLGPVELIYEKIQTSTKSLLKG